MLVFTDWVTLGQCWNLSELLSPTCKSNGNDTLEGPCEVQYTEVALPKLPSACILRQQSPAISHRDCDKSHTCLDRSFYFRRVTAELATAEGLRGKTVSAINSMKSDSDVSGNENTHHFPQGEGISQTSVNEK